MKIILTIIILAAFISTSTANDADDLPTFTAYENAGKMTLLVGYADDAAHDNILSQTVQMKSKGKYVQETINHKFKKARKIKDKDGSAKGAKSSKRNRFLQEDAMTSGYSVIEVESDYIKYEMDALKEVEGVVSVEIDSMMHVASSSDSTASNHQHRLRGKSTTTSADHMKDIQDAIKTAADQLSEQDDGAALDHDHERRLGEDTPWGINMVKSAYVNQKPDPVGAEPIKICVVDTGYGNGHADLPSIAQHGVAGFKPSSYGGKWRVDGHGHGTHCAGTIGAIGGNNNGVTSVNPDPSKFKFFIGKGLTDTGSGSSSGVLQSVQACVNAGAKVISMSLSGGSYSSTANAQYEEHYDDNVLIFAAAGNSGSSAKTYPASYSSVVSIGAIDSNKNKAGFSQYNNQVELSAPGVSVKSTIPPQNYATWSGTSMATPHAAGVAALLWYHFPSCTNNQIRNAMINSAEDLGPSSWDSGFGWGLVNAKAAYNLLANGGCVAAGGAYPANDQSLSSMAQGGKDQVSQGSTPPPPPAPSPPSCPSSAQKRLQVEIMTDSYPSETTWTITDKCSSNNQVIMSSNDYSSAHTEYSQDICAENKQYEFKINDMFGDGMCCDWGEGSYKVSYGNTVVAEGGNFGSTQSTTFGSCNSQPNPTPTYPTNPPPNPPTNPTPAPPSYAQPQDAAFDSTYGAPRCANVGSECDSLQLLRGRGTINNGGEPNRSNTNKFGPTCNDGNSGSFHGDESIDKITVTAGDVINGSPVPSGDFIVEGGRAYVSVDIWCWGSGASDFADIYLASNANSPSWQHLNTIGCPGGGARTIVHAFDVPQGANQSIRVNFRYAGSKSPCSNGSYDDHDDLIFAVKSNSGPPPAPSPTPPSPPGNSGPQMATYFSWLGAPRCSYGSRCDSGNLLNSRGAISGLAEPNTLNTLDSCSDGGSGTYHADESIDKIVVSGNGSDDFKEGDTVTITASVWCYGTGASDYIDFYYTSNAASLHPVWNQIGSRQQCPGGQAQTVSASYTLPQGGLQAVRVNLMYGLGNPGINRCTSGNYDDTDDLVISVKPNPNAASLSIASEKVKGDFAIQGVIEETTKDDEADAVKAKLQEMNHAERIPRGSEEGDDGRGNGSSKGGKKSSKKKGRKGSNSEAEGASSEAGSTGRFVCAEIRPHDEIICEEGSESLHRCNSEGDICGRDKYCFYAECDEMEADS